jgi:hypothetical protein
MAKLFLALTVAAFVTLICAFLLAAFAYRSPHHRLILRPPQVAASFISGVSTNFANRHVC